ncbi:MAG TPA: HU family DNA-binding protein [Pirellulaceae bacterium]|nr:HU family DNA-binding protein [Pirellulaceae bacterium]HMO94042.1 HU family DNA-binding protein [Pirellulaceae bacterium]HMP70912.1 HU family DNA-binding protein [Pirellulaceae bacterium]
MAKTSKGPKPLTKAQITQNLAEATGLSKKEIEAVLKALTDEIKSSITGRDCPGQFTIPGLCKIKVAVKPALPRREVRNPGTGEMKWVDARPASKVVKVRPLKGLKDMVA